MKQVNARVEASVDRALAEGKIGTEVTRLTKDGYSEALQFINGDIDMANQLFTDLATGSEDIYNSSEVQFDKFELYLQYDDSPLAEAGRGSMKLNDSSGGSITLGDTIASTLAQGQKSAQESKRADKQAVPIITDILNHLT